MEGRLKTAAVEWNYKEVDRQLKEQFIHGLNGSEMLTEIIRECTKTDEDIIILSELVLTWAKRVEAPRAEVAVINSLHELKNFDAILQMDKGKQREKNGNTCENACKKKMQILRWGPQTEMLPNIWEEVWKWTTSKRYAEVPKAAWSIT